MRRTVLAAALAAALTVAVGGSATAGPPIVTGLDGCPTPTQWRVLPLGDSITNGVGSSGQYGRSYRGWLINRLRGTGGVNMIYVGSLSDGSGAHEGHNGWTANDLANIVDDRIDTYRPDLVLMHAGTNTENRDAERTWAAMSLLTNRILAHPCVRLVVAKTTPAFSDGPRSVVQKYCNERVPTLAARDPARVRWVDFSGMPAAMFPDGLHPNDVGYDTASFMLYDQVQHLISPNGYLPATAVNLPLYPTQTGS